MQYIKSLNPELFHMTIPVTSSKSELTFIAQCAMNCAMDEFNSHFEKVDQPIAKVKSARVKNITR